MYRFVNGCFSSTFIVLLQVLRLKEFVKLLLLYEGFFYFFNVFSVYQIKYISLMSVPLISNICNQMTSIQAKL